MERLPRAELDTMPSIDVSDIDRIYFAPGWEDRVAARVEAGELPITVPPRAGGSDDYQRVVPDEELRTPPLQVTLFDMMMKAAELDDDDFRCSIDQKHPAHYWEATNGWTDDIEAAERRCKGGESVVQLRGLLTRLDRNDAVLHHVWKYDPPKRRWWHRRPPAPASHDAISGATQAIETLLDAINRLLVAVAGTDRPNYPTYLEEPLPAPTGDPTHDRVMILVWRLRGIVAYVAAHAADAEG